MEVANGHGANGAEAGTSGSSVEVSPERREEKLQLAFAQHMRANRLERVSMTEISAVVNAGNPLAFSTGEITWILEKMQNNNRVMLSEFIHSHHLRTAYFGVLQQHIKLDVTATSTSPHLGGNRDQWLLKVDVTPSMPFAAANASCRTGASTLHVYWRSFGLILAV